MLDTREEKEELSLVILVENELDAASNDVVLVEKDELAATKLEAVTSVLVVLVENEALAATKLEAVVSVFVTLVDKDPEAVSKLVSLVDIEPDPRQLTANDELIALDAVKAQLAEIAFNPKEEVAVKDADKA